MGHPLVGPTVDIIVQCLDMFACPLIQYWTQQGLPVLVLTFEKVSAKWRLYSDRNDYLRAQETPANKIWCVVPMFGKMCRKNVFLAGVFCQLVLLILFILNWPLSDFLSVTQFSKQSWHSSERNKQGTAHVATFSLTLFPQCSCNSVRPL